MIDVVTENAHFLWRTWDRVPTAQSAGPLWQCALHVVVRVLWIGVVLTETPTLPSGGISDSTPTRQRRACITPAMPGSAASR